VVAAAAIVAGTCVAAAEGGTGGAVTGTGT
jgi:hypothetical protein